MSMRWQARAAAKRQAVLDLIPEKWRIPELPAPEIQKDVTGSYVENFLDARQIEITNADAVAIAEQIRARVWSAVEVTTAFCHRAALAHQMVNCLHEIFFEDAIAEARRLDQYQQSKGKTSGPLHGVPVSLKDQFHVRGVDTTMGYVGWINTFEGDEQDGRKRVVESQMVTDLRDLGAVLYCKTAVPHSLMAGETVNNIIGYTHNPRNRFLTAGGSSGGEGALIGLRGSPIGIGTDIGGSIRVPGAFNGLYSLRPSSGRLPYEGAANSNDGQNSVLSVVGPLATSARSMRLITEGLISRQPWLHDPMVVEMPWRDDQEQPIRGIMTGASSKKLNFGLWASDGIVNPQPPVARAISMLVEALSKAGHTIIPWTPPSHERGFNVAFKSWIYDGGRDIHSTFKLSGEDVAPQIQAIYGKEIAPEYSATQIAQNNVARRRWLKEYLDYWNSTASATPNGQPVDAFISPVAVYAAARPQKYKYHGYSTYVNCLDYSTVTVPVTYADASLDRYPADYQCVSEQDKVCFNDYDPVMYDGAHVGVQIVGRRYTEEKVIAIAEYIGSLLT